MSSNGEGRERCEDPIAVLFGLVTVDSGDTTVVWPPPTAEPSAGTT